MTSPYHEDRVPVYIHMYTLEGTTGYSTHSNEQPTQMTCCIIPSEVSIGTLEWIYDPQRVQDASDKVFTV